MRCLRRGAAGPRARNGRRRSNFDLHVQWTAKNWLGAVSRAKVDNLVAQVVIGRPGRKPDALDWLLGR